MIDLSSLAKEAGFGRCWLFQPAPFSRYQSRQREGTLHPLGQNLNWNPKEAYPWANGLLLLLWPYKPLPRERQISGYYMASNAAYHGAGELIRLLEERGIQVQRADVPVRELALQHGVGQMLKNGLTCWGELGSRVAVQVLAVALPEPVTYDPDGALPRINPLCKGCSLCRESCPTHAIGQETGFCYQDCLRGRIEKEPMEEEIMARLPALFGCELCQYACPLNGGIGEDEKAYPAFGLESLLRGETGPVLALVGKNLNKGGRPIAHACILAANNGRTDLLPLVTQHLADHRSQVQQAAQWAVKRLESLEKTSEIKKDG